MVKRRRHGGLQESEKDSCELLLSLHRGVTGQVRLGRLLEGSDAGRLVMLRPLENNTVRRVRPLVEQVSKISHPRLLKVLGCVRAEGKHYVASEYLPGASFSEILPCMSGNEMSHIAVAVSVLRDALEGAHAGRRQLEEDYGYLVERCVFEDAIWVAEYGEAFVTELSVFEALLFDKTVDASAVRGVRAPRPSNVGDDVAAALSVLFRLLASRSERARSVPNRPTDGNKDLARVVSRALSPSALDGFSDTGELARALAGLPEDLRASSDAVSAFMAAALRGTLELRREQLRLLECSSAVQSDGERTRFHRSSGLTDAHRVSTIPPPRLPRPPSKVTQRFPALSAPPPLAPSKVVPIEGAASESAEAPPVNAPQPDDAQTTLWVRRETAPGQGPVDDAVTHVRAARRDEHEASKRPVVDEDATSVYVASRQPPGEPSIVIQDEDATDVYLSDSRHLTHESSVGPEDTTELSGRRAGQPAHTTRWALKRAAVFLLLMVLSALLTVAIAGLL